MPTRSLREFWHQLCRRPAGVLGAAVAPRLQRHFAAAHQVEEGRVLQVAGQFQVGHRVEAARAAGVAADEHQLVGIRPVRTPGEVMRRLGGFVVLVDAEKGHVEAVARVLEVIRIAAEVGDVAFGSEDEPDVGVFLVAIKVV